MVFPLENTDKDTLLTWRIPGPTCFDNWRSQFDSLYLVWYPSIEWFGLSPPQVALLRFFVAGFRGDWKALAQVFSFNRSYNRNQASKFGFDMFWRNQRKSMKLFSSDRSGRFEFLGTTSSSKLEPSCGTLRRYVGCAGPQKALMTIWTYASRTLLKMLRFGLHIWIQTLGKRTLPIVNSMASMLAWPCQIYCMSGI